MNTWSHLAVTYNGSRARLYLNGNQIGDEPVSGTIQDDGGDFHIGGNTIYGEFFDGVIDEVRVYNRAQTAAEITADMNTPIEGTGVAAQATTSRTANTASSSGGEVCTSKTEPLEFSTPGTPPDGPLHELRHVTLGKDNITVKTAKN
ncbi:LamG domain-containing protein [Nonomuraea ferruginea]